jgi:hypothetical protein
VNTNGLAKLYDKLTPRERLPLIYAASARGDEVERDRLLRSAPTVPYGIPDFYPLAEGMLLVTLLHQVELLNLAVLYWHVQGRLERLEALPRRGKKDREAQLLRAVRTAAYLFTALRDGWQQFCASRQVDPDTPLNRLSGWEIVCLTEEAARSLAVTFEEATAWARRDGDAAAKPVTADSVAASLRATLDFFMSYWK